MANLLMWFIIFIGFCSVNGILYPSVRVRRGDLANLTCWEQYSTKVAWMTFDDKIIDSATASDKYFVDDNGTLHIMDARKNDSGTYRCVSRVTEGEYNVMRLSLEVIDISYIPEIDDWQSNLIRGVISGVCVAAFFIASCGLYHFRWIGDKPERHSSISSRHSHQSGQKSGSSSTSLKRKNHSEPQAFDNPALSLDTTELDGGL